VTRLIPIHRQSDAAGGFPRARGGACIRFGVAAALLALGTVPAILQAQQTASVAARVALAPASAFDSAALSSMKWREIGPYRGGRSVAVAGSVARPDEYWMGTTGGGVFKSTDGGRNWAPASDGYFGGSIGAITVDATNPDIVYVGTGETPIRGNVTNGDGVWKTTDGGKTWKHLGLTETRQIDRIVIHPTNPNRIYLAALGNVFKPTKERGVYRSDDAGATWKQILFRSDSAGAIDLEIDPSNPNVMYVSFWQAGRTPWMLSSGGRWSGIFKSTDGGDNWTDISRANGLPKGVMGKIGLALSPVNPQRLWAQIEAEDGGLYRSEDGGQNWALINDDRSLRQRAWYYSHLHADPKDVNTIYAQNTGFYRSTDGGKTLKNIPVPHGDNHDLWIDPTNPLRMIESNDGGANVSTDGGKTWTEQDYATAQFYHVTTSNDFPYHVCGAQQDNSTLCGPSAKPGGITMSDWYDVGGGESGYIAIDPRDPNIAYAGSYGGLLTRKDRRTGISRNVSPWPLNPMGHSSEDIQYRFQWTFPIVFSRHNPQTLYAGGSQLFRTTDEGHSWTIVSPPLARRDPKTMGPSGGPITKDQTGVETYATIFAFDESPITAGLLWAGTDDGNVQISRDAGATWTDVTPPKSMLPDFARISIIEPGHYSPGTAYVAANRYQMADMQPYLLKTTDYGKTWTRIDNGITGDSEFTRVIREDPVRPGLLFAGTERGVWVSFDDGASWRSLRQNLPIVPVHDMTIKNGDLVVATHGRSFYIMDDLSALRQLTPEIVASAAHLFAPADAYRVQWSGGFGGGGGSSPVGANPPSGAIVRYWLKAPAREVALEFLDSKGQVIHTFRSAADTTKPAAGAPAGRGGMRGPSGPPNKAGMNQFAWDMRYPDADTFRGIIMWAGRGTGPVAPPGTYQVRMLVDGQPVKTESFNVLKDPRGNATQADLDAQFALLIQIRDRLSDANNGVRTIRNVKYQLTESGAKLRGRDSTAFARAANQFAERLSKVEQELYQVKNRSGQDPLNFPIRLNNEIAALTNHVASGESAPTKQAYEVFDLLSKRLDVQLAALKSVLDADLPRINAMLEKAGQAKIVPSTEELGPDTSRGIVDDGNELREEKEKYWH